MDSINESMPVNISIHNETTYGFNWNESISANLQQITSLAEKAIFRRLFDDSIGSSDDQLNLVYGNDALTRIQQLYHSYVSGDVPSIISALGVNVKVVDTVTGVDAGAYSKTLNTIFLSDRLILNNTLELAAEVLIEEIGHAVDNAINRYGDSPGDEGELFSAYVLGKNLESLPASVFIEEDVGKISFHGDDLLVEFNKSVTLFQDAAYTGRAKTFGIGSYAFIGADFNDIATSIRISPNQNIVVELYEHANFQGRSTVISYSQASIGADWNDPNWRVSHLNDAVSSIRVREQLPNEVIMYQHANFQGLGHSEQLGNKRLVRFNDDYSSIDLPSGARIDLFEHSSYGGRKISLTSDAATLGILNDRVSSFQAYRPSNIAEVADVLVDRFKLLNPSQTLNALKWYGLLTNNSVINSVIKQVQSITGVVTGFNKVRSGDPVNGIQDLFNVPPLSPWKYIPSPLKNQVVTGLRAITGENVNGVRISDLLN